MAYGIDTKVSLPSRLAISKLLRKNYSKVHAGLNGITKVKWHTQDAVRTIIFSDTLVSKELAMSIQSVPVLVNKGIEVFFQPGKALFIGLEDRMNILGTAAQAEDGLIYHNLVLTVPETEAYSL